LELLCTIIERRVLYYYIKIC